MWSRKICGSQPTKVENVLRAYFRIFELREVRYLSSRFSHEDSQKVNLLRRLLLSFLSRVLVVLIFKQGHKALKRVGSACECILYVANLLVHSRFAFATLSHPFTEIVLWIVVLASEGRITNK